MKFATNALAIWVAMPSASWSRVGGPRTLHESLVVEDRLADLASRSFGRRASRPSKSFGSIRLRDPLQRNAARVQAVDEARGIDRRLGEGRCLDHDRDAVEVAETRASYWV